MISIIYYLKSSYSIIINYVLIIYNNECREIFLYLAMRQIAYKEGYYKIGDIYKKIALEEENHAVLLSEILR